MLNVTSKDEIKDNYIQLECPLLEMFGMRIVLDFKQFQILKCLHIHIEILRRQNPSLHIYTLDTQPVGCVTQYFQCTCSLTETHHMRSNVKFSTYGIMSTLETLHLGGAFQILSLQITDTQLVKGGQERMTKQKEMKQTQKVFQRYNNPKR